MRRLGDDGLAATALRSVVIEAAESKRWPADKVEAEARTPYADLIASAS